MSNFNATSIELAPHIARLIDTNKEVLINAAVANPSAREKLLEINKAINELRAVDPDQVAAWGLGCGGSCIAVDIRENLTRF